MCQKYDVIIVEDEPYWNLQYPSAYELEKQYRGESQVKESRESVTTKNKSAGGYEFLDSLVPSFLTIDTDGRVVRLDTFSKTVAPGARLGWLTAQPAVIERITRIAECSTQQPSGFVQAMVAELLVGPATVNSNSSPGWQMDGWVRWLAGLRSSYEGRMQTMCRVLEEGKYTVRDDTKQVSAHATSRIFDDSDAWEVIDRAQMYDFSWPRGGMFVWVKIHLSTHPLYPRYSGERLSRALWVHLAKKPYQCIVAPGMMFAPTAEVMGISHQFLRLCFAAMDGAEVEDTSKRLVQGFRTFWQRKNLDDLEDPEDERFNVSALLELMHV